jgi:acyl-CoA dehydrogenase
MGTISTPHPEGIPTEKEHVAEYCRVRGIAMPPAHAWAFYVALGMFRAASILAGVYTRALQGNASAANAARVGAPSIVRDMATTALQLLLPGSTAQWPEYQAAALVSAERPAPLLVEAHALRPSPRCAQLLTRLQAFMAQHIAVADAEFIAHSHGPDRWQPFPLMEALKTSAKAERLWNLWVPPDLAGKLDLLLSQSRLPSREAALLRGPALSNLDYAYLACEMGAVPWCPEVFNCSAPDTGNMEVLARYGSLAQQTSWLLPLLRGNIRSCFAMTEHAVASSDATNIQSAQHSCLL